MSVSERMSRLSNLVYDRMRDRRAFSLRTDNASDGTFDGLRGHKYAVVVTFRRNGDRMRRSHVPEIQTVTSNCVYNHRFSHTGETVREAWTVGMRLASGRLHSGRAMGTRWTARDRGADSRNRHACGGAGDRRFLVERCG